MGLTVFNHFGAILGIITFDNTAAKGISTSLNYFDRNKQDGESFKGEQQQAPDQGDSQVHGPSWT